MLAPAFSLCSTVPSTHNVFPPDVGVAHFLTIFKSLLNRHLVNEAFLDLPTTLFYTAWISALSAALCFHVELSTFHRATHFTVSLTRVSVPGGQFCLFSLLLCLQHLEQCLAQTTNIQESHGSHGGTDFWDSLQSF